MEEKNAGIKMEANSHMQKTSGIGTKRRKPGQAKADKALAELDQYRERSAVAKRSSRTQPTVKSIFGIGSPFCRGV